MWYDSQKLGKEERAVCNLPQTMLDRFLELLVQHPQWGGWFTTLIRFLFPLLALAILGGVVFFSRRFPDGAPPA